MSSEGDFHVHLFGHHRGPLAISFEQLEARLAEVPRLYFEPDGSFVWRGEGWQLDAMIYDHDGRLQSIDLKAQRLPLAVWVRLLGWLRLEPGEGELQRLPAGQWQDLQTFEASVWSQSDRTAGSASP